MIRRTKAKAASTYDPTAAGVSHGTAVVLRAKGASVPPDGRWIGGEIARRAYRIYERNGRRDGHDLEDWLEAERQILAEQISQWASA